MGIITEKNLDKYLSPLSYAKVAHRRDVNNKNYLSKKVIYDKKSGIMKTIKYDKEWSLKQSYIYNTLKIDELNLQCIENDMIPIFITLTLPSEYHPTTTIRGFREKNKKYDSEKTATVSYNRLIEIYRDLYNNFMIDRKKVKGLKFIRVIEPHSDFTPHLHAVIYVPKHAKDVFKNHFSNIVKKYLLKQTDYKELDAVNYATTYLLKYVQKTLEGDDTIRGWKIHHSINRVLTMSNLNNGINREVFKRVSSLISFDENSDLNYFRQILSKVLIKRTIIDSVEIIQKKEVFGNEKSNILVDYTVKRVRKIGDFEGFISVEYNENEDDNIVFQSHYIDNKEYPILIQDEIKESLYDEYYYQLFKFKIYIRDEIYYNKDDIIIDYRSNYYE